MGKWSNYQAVIPNVDKATLFFQAPVLSRSL